MKISENFFPIVRIFSLKNNKPTYSNCLLSTPDLLPQKEREARRTVFIDNLHPCLTAEHVLNFFQFCGDVRFLRLGGEWMEKRR